MNTTTAADRDAILLLSVPLAGDDQRPLTPGQWRTVETAIQRSDAGSQAELLGQSAAEIAALLDLDLALSEHVARLLDRGGPLAVELERLEARGIWVTTQADEDYPVRLTNRLGTKAPPALFGAGERAILDQGGIAIVGSRNASDAAAAFARDLAGSLASKGVSVTSGAARGIDQEAMGAALGAGGIAVGVLADSLVRAARAADTRAAVADGLLVLVSQNGSDLRFTVGAAMARNKLIYCLADAAVVVATTRGTGGTWAGAAEALKAGWIPVWAWTGEGAPEGNQALLNLGARPLTLAPESPQELIGTKASDASADSQEQTRLFE